MRETTKYLLKFGIGGTCIGMGALFGLRSIISQDILGNSSYTIEAKQLFYRNRTIISILGTPIKEHSIKALDVKHNFQDNFQAQVYIPVKGTLTSGHIYVHALKNLVTGEWKLDNVSLKSEDMKRTIYSVLPLDSFPQE